MGDAGRTQASDIEVRRDGMLTHLVLARGHKGNSLSAALVEEITAAVTRAYSDGTRALLVQGRGRNFCTGFDLSDLESETDDSLLARFVRVELLLQLVYRAPFLTAALANGKAWGAGADLFAACTLRWAHPDTSFAFPGAAFGVVLGTGRLGAVVKASTASEWILTGRRIAAPEAEQAGLVTRVVEKLEPDQAVSDLRSLVRRLDASTLAEVCTAVQQHSETDDAVDLARLIRSAADPGLKDRIAVFKSSIVPDS